MPLLAPKSSVNAATAYSFDATSQSYIHPAEIEMLVSDEDEYGMPRRDSRASTFSRRRRCCLVALILLAIVIATTVAVVTITKKNDSDEVPKATTQQGSGSQSNQEDNETPSPTFAPVMAPPPTDSPTARPTASPTQGPTASPVLQPTGAPPTPAPPTAAPPTAFPTAFPTAQLTSSPTGQPTASPTASPTSGSAVSPLTESPTISTTNEPTAETQDDNNNEDYSTWYAASVTLSKGRMFQIVDQLSHDAGAFTQGLTFANGRLFESTGLNGYSSIRELDPNTGDVLVSVPLDYQYFGEGLVYAHDKLVQITWKTATAFVYDPNDLTIPPQVITYKTTNHDEGWGITHDPTKDEFIVSDGSSNLIFWNVDTLETLRTIGVVRQDGTPATNMNELEFWRGRVLANVWFQDLLLVIHPETGVVEKEYDFSSLWPKSDRPRGTDVFNGISVSEDPNVLYVTGKKWNRMYKVKLLP